MYEEKPTLVYRRGTAIMFFSGEYSDYGPEGCIVTIQDCDLPQLVQKYLAQEGDDAAPSMFVSWLVAHGYAMPAEVQNVHLGSYGEFDSIFLED